MVSDANAFLMGTGGKSATFHNVKDMVWGTILSAETRQQTKMGSGELLFWDDGKPRMQLVITLQTELQEDEDDDGIRKVYAKGNMATAIRKAVVKAGRNGLDVGGKLAIQYVKDGESKRAGFNAPKVYGAKYEPPTQHVAFNDDEMANDETGDFDDSDSPF